MLKKYIKVLLFILPILCCVAGIGCGEKTILSAPTNIYIDEYDYLRWDEVYGADEYVVYINDDEYYTDTNSLDIFELTAEPGRYLMGVMACSSDGSFVDSDWSAEFERSLDYSDLLIYKEVKDGYQVYSSDKEKISGKIIVPPTYRKKPVVSIFGQAFAKIENEYSVILPDTITRFDEIGHGGYPCAVFARSSLTRIKLPGGITRINKMLFQQCTLLRELTIPNSVKFINNNAFSDCTSLKHLKLSNNTELMSSNALTGYSPDIVITTDEGGVSKVDSNCLIHNGCLIWTLDKKTVPEGVIYIEASFSGATFEELTIPASVQTIGRNVFYGCKNLKKVNVLSTDLIIIDGAFAMCTSLESISFAEGLKELREPTGPGVYTIFEACTSLKSIHLPASVEYIAPGLFTNKSGIEQITIDENNPVYKSEGNCIIRRSGNVLVSGCSGSVIPDCVEVIQSDAFHNCINLSSLVIPEDVKTIQSNAFRFADSCSIILPQTVREIEDNAFHFVTIYTDAYGEIPEGWANYQITLPDGTVATGCSIMFLGNIYEGCVFGGKGSQKYVVSVRHGEIIEIIDTTPELNCYYPYVPCREGYVFKGWAQEPGGEVVYPVRETPRLNIYDYGTKPEGATPDPQWTLLVVLPSYYTSLSYEEMNALPVGTTLYAVWDIIE